MPESYPRGSAAAWNDFRKVSIPHHARTILYRNLLLHNKLVPCRGSLHKLLPNRFPSPLCPLCHQPESPQHFILTCPLKSIIWSQICYKLLNQQRSLTCRDILNVRIIRYKVLPHFKLEWAHIVACTIASIWKAHWQHVFDEASFDPNTVVAEAIAASIRIA